MRMDNPHFATYTTPEEAAALAVMARAAKPEHKYEVRKHNPKWEPPRLFSDGYPETWGVIEFVPYCPQMPWRCEGFINWGREV